jgi:predicted SAM-dependent methyltransferase
MAIIDALSRLTRGARAETPAAVPHSVADLVSRETLALAYLSGAGLEIGALQNPLKVPPTASVKYVDRLSRDDLRLQYPELQGCPLVEVDLIDEGERLNTIADGSQDFVIANHFLEHCQDPIEALGNVIRVLRSGGIAYLAVPDKRFTFDRDRPTTSLDHLVRDHEEGPEWSKETHFLEWVRFVEPTFGRVYPTDAAVSTRVRQLMEMDYSIHFHNWTTAEITALLGDCIGTLHFPIFMEVFVSMGHEMIYILKRR